MGRPRLTSSLRLATVLLGAWSACTRGPAGPTSFPSPPAGNEITSVCHRVQDTSSFALTLVSASDLFAHLSHGDGYAHDWVPGGQPTTRFGPACEFVSLTLATITFDHLLGDDGTPFTPYDENGLTVTNTNRPWVVRETFGRPGPSIIFFNDEPQRDTVGELQIVSKYGSFAFRSVELYSSVTAIPYSIIGTRQTRETIAVTGTVPGTYGAFATVSTSDLTLFETLTIRLANPPSACCRNPMGLDNITVLR